MSDPPRETTAAGADGTDGGPHQTVAPKPRDRIFLMQSGPERLACSLWNAMRLVLFRFTPAWANAWRMFVLRRFGATIGRNVFIHPSVRIDFPWNLTIESDVHVEHGVILNCMGAIQIASGTRISQYSHLCAGTHAYEQRDMPIIRTPIRIGRDVWIAADAFVGPGVTVEDGSLLAARSSAFNRLPAGQICIGEPARPRRPRFGHGEAGDSPSPQQPASSPSPSSSTDGPDDRPGPPAGG